MFDRRLSGLLAAVSVAASSSSIAPRDAPALSNPSATPSAPMLLGHSLREAERAERSPPPSTKDSIDRSIGVEKGSPVGSQIRVDGGQSPANTGFADAAPPTSGPSSTQADARNTAAKARAFAVRDILAAVPGAQEVAAKWNWSEAENTSDGVTIVPPAADAPPLHVHGAEHADRFKGRMAINFGKHIEILTPEALGPRLQRLERHAEIYGMKFNEEAPRETRDRVLYASVVLHEAEHSNRGGWGAGSEFRAFERQFKLLQDSGVASGDTRNSAMRAASIYPPGSYAKSVISFTGESPQDSITPYLPGGREYSDVHAQWAVELQHTQPDSARRMNARASDPSMQRHETDSLITNISEVTTVEYFQREHATGADDEVAFKRAEQKGEKFAARVRALSAFAETTTVDLK